MKYAVYRLLDREGHLLYVGRSKDPFKRFAQHMSGQPWLAEVSKCVETWYPDFVTAAVAEREAVRDEHPKYNSHYAPTLVCPRCGGEKEAAPSYCRPCKRIVNREYRRKKLGLLA